MKDTEKGEPMLMQMRLNLKKKPRSNPGPVREAPKDKNKGEIQNLCDYMDQIYPFEGHNLKIRLITIFEDDFSNPKMQEGIAMFYKTIERIDDYREKQLDAAYLKLEKYRR